MASGDPPSALARLAEKAARAFEAGDYAEARRCVGDLELEARVGGNSLHSRDAARLAQNVAVLDLLDTEREGRLDAAGFRDSLRRALSAFEASSASDAEPADPEADARESRVLRTNVAWALTRCGDDASPYSRPTHLEVVSVLEGVFDETVATDDGCCSTDTLHETIHVASMLTRALAVSGSREDAEKALRILSVAEAMAKPFGDADDALAWTLRERARASMALGDLVTAKEALVRAGQTNPKSQTSQKKKSRDELGSLRARLAYLEGDGAAALRAFGERKADTKRTASRDDARTLNLASVFELSGASATASLLLDSMCSRQPRDADADAVTEARTDESDANDAFSLAKKHKQKTAAYRAGVTLLRAKKPAAAALRVLAGGDAVGAPETFVRLAECACAHAVRGGEVGEDEREAAAAFVAASDGVPLTFSGAQTYLDSAIAEMRCDDEDKASSRFRQPRLRAHAHAQRAYVCLALGKRLDALASANETLALVDAAAKNAKGRRRKEDAKGSAVEEDGFEGGELEAYARLAKTYAAEALTSLGRHEEAAKVTQSKAS